MKAIAIIAYIFITGMQFYAASMFVHKRLRRDSIADTFIALSIVAISQQVLTGWVLGMIGHLFALELFVVNAVISILLIIFSLPGRRDWLEPIRLNWRLLTNLRRLCRRPEFLLFFLADFFLLLMLTVKGIIYPPYSWDGVHYHLGQVGFMIQDGGLGIIKSYPL